MLQVEQEEGVLDGITIQVDSPPRYRRMTAAQRDLPAAIGAPPTTMALPQQQVGPPGVSLANTQQLVAPTFISRTILQQVVPGLYQMATSSS